MTSIKEQIIAKQNEYLDKFNSAALFVKNNLRRFFQEIFDNYEWIESFSWIQGFVYCDGDGSPFTVLCYEDCISINDVKLRYYQEALEELQIDQDTLFEVTEHINKMVEMLDPRILQEFGENIKLTVLREGGILTSYQSMD